MQRLTRWLKFNWMYFRRPPWDTGISQLSWRWLSFACLLLTACGGPVLLTAAPTMSPEPVMLTPSPEVTVTATVYDGLCAYVWANQPLVDESLALSQAVRAAGLTQVESQATAYGENCVDTGSNAVVQFTAQQTNFFFDVAVADASDSQAIGQWVLLLFDILEKFPPGVVPGVNQGQVEMVFQDGVRSAALGFPQAVGWKLIDQGLRGSALYEALLREQ